MSVMTGLIRVLCSQKCHIPIVLTKKYILLIFFQAEATTTLTDYCGLVLYSTDIKVTKFILSFVQFEV